MQYNSSIEMRLGRMLPHHAKTTSPKLKVQQRSYLIMIQDPEKEPERWDEPILADNLKQAKQECQKRADRCTHTQILLAIDDRCSIASNKSLNLSYISCN
ncbi:MAG: hypothetical protein EAZ78_25940 [Oscillatoriales cyanobacterium]|nr:MAG: hypothetical protein EA000_07825 [Oscillatoriales cyanobacterium]TAE97282.1 MAG: hypothetical protein EAZ78_25940 [Oscillatoriales cyanobacterium]TAF61412.1 MAG: hypothetical protein EAZ59_25675 [Oscillatoriales cyanobacterium]